jgi:hypothetical protein
MPSVKNVHLTYEGTSSAKVKNWDFSKNCYIWWHVTSIYLNYIVKEDMEGIFPYTRSCKEVLFINCGRSCRMWKPLKLEQATSLILGLGKMFYEWKKRSDSLKWQVGTVGIKAGTSRVNDEHYCLLGLTPFSLVLNLLEGCATSNRFKGLLFFSLFSDLPTSPISSLKSLISLFPKEWK